MAVAMVIIAGTVVLALVALVAAAGFVVMAQRRLRQLGMLGAIGGSEGHVRFVVLTNGFIVGADRVYYRDGVRHRGLDPGGAVPGACRRLSDRAIRRAVVADCDGRGARGRHSYRRCVVAGTLDGARTDCPGAVGTPVGAGRWHGPVAIAVLALVFGVSCLAWTNGDILSNEELHMRAGAVYGRRPPGDDAWRPPAEPADDQGAGVGGGTHARCGAPGVARPRPLPGALRLCSRRYQSRVGAGDRCCDHRDVGAGLVRRRQPVEPSAFALGAEFATKGAGAGGIRRGDSRRSCSIRRRRSWRAWKRKRIASRVRWAARR